MRNLQETIAECDRFEDKRHQLIMTSEETFSYGTVAKYECICGLKSEDFYKHIRPRNLKNVYGDVNGWDRKEELNSNTGEQSNIGSSSLFAK